MSIKELIERLERATGPDRELDAAIAQAIGIDIGYFVRDMRGNFIGVSNNVTIPACTSSIDAALTLYKSKPDRVPSDPRKACVEALKQWL